MVGVLSTQGNPPAPSDALTPAERTDARRFCGFPAYGLGSTFDQVAFGPFEFRLQNLSETDLVVARSYLAALRKLECEILCSTANIGILTAAVVTRNPNEIRDRERIFDSWRMRFCQFIGVTPGPEMQSSGVTRIVI